ncbi:hypothetical protein [Microcoleus sp. LEGE 07076]|nr:hypothetical protein [Microcoleus sp. LEGE 07076]
MIHKPAPQFLSTLLNIDRLAVFYSWLCNQGRSQLNCQQAR